MIAKDKLIKLLENNDYVYVRVADSINVDEKTIRNWCRKYKISKPKKTYDIKDPLSDIITEPVDIGALKRKALRDQALNWTIKKSTRKKTARPFKSYLIIADVHIPKYNKPSVKCVLQIMEDYAFDGFWILGDYMDMTPISHWLQDKNKRKSLENQRIKEDYIEGALLLDEFDKRLPKDCDKRFTYGNHELWERDLIEKMPALEGMFNPKIELKLLERGYKVYTEENHIERLSGLNLLHGMYCGLNHTRQHIDKMKTNIMYGHLHTGRMRLESSPAKELAICGYSIPCLCDINPDYMKNKPSSWSHGFAVVHVFNPKEFDVDIKRIIRGKCVYNGKLYNGN